MKKKACLVTSSHVGMPLELSSYHVTMIKILLVLKNLVRKGMIYELLLHLVRSKLFQIITNESPTLTSLTAPLFLSNRRQAVLLQNPIHDHSSLATCESDTTRTQ